MKYIVRSFFIAFMFAFSDLASAGGGLNAATTALTNVKTWAFTFVGIASLVYLLYLVVSAFMERKSWSDVGMGLVYCAIAGGCVTGGTWMLSLFQ